MQHDPQRPRTNLKPFIIASIALALASLLVLCLLLIAMAAVRTTTH
jgi:hypothetical protein